MSEADVQALLAAIEQVRTEVTTQEAAQEMLRGEGYLTASGDLAEPYAKDV